MLAIGLVLLFVLLFSGLAVWVVFGGVGAFLCLFMEHLPMSFIGQNMFSGMNKFILLCLPYFILMGNFMVHSGASRALFRFVDDLVGHLPGGMPAAAILSCMVFASLTGSSIATVIGIGSIAIPELDRLGYPKKFSLGLMACSGTLGQMIPPSVYAILYGSLTNIDVGLLFISQVIPGLITTLVLLVIATSLSIRGGYVAKRTASSWEQRLHSFVPAIPSLLLPIIVLGGIYGGVFTPTEAAAVGCVYAFLAGIFIYRGLTKDSIKKSLFSSMMTTCTIYVILAGCDIFSKAMASALIPKTIAAWIAAMGFTPIILLLAVSLMYLAFGCIIDPVPILFLTIPTIFPAIVGIGIDPVFFCPFTVSWMMVAQVTPPFGVSLFALSSHFKVPIATVVHGALPFLFGLIISTLIITFFPILSLWLPHQMGLN